MNSNRIMSIPQNGEPTLDPQRNFEGKLRETILKRDNHRCVVCQSSEKLQIDHVIPHAQRGRTCLENGQTLCCWCNRSKGAQRQEEWEKKKSYRNAKSWAATNNPKLRTGKGLLAHSQTQYRGHKVWTIIDGNQILAKYKFTGNKLEIRLSEDKDRVIKYLEGKIPEEYNLIIFKKNNAPSKAIFKKITPEEIAAKKTKVFVENLKKDNWESIHPKMKVNRTDKIIFMDKTLPFEKIQEAKEKGYTVIINDFSVNPNPIVV